MADNFIPGTSTERTGNVMLDEQLKQEEQDRLKNNPDLSMPPAPLAAEPYAAQMSDLQKLNTAPTVPNEPPQNFVDRVVASPAPAPNTKLPEYNKVNIPQEQQQPVQQPVQQQVNYGDIQNPFQPAYDIQSAAIANAQKAGVLKANAEESYYKEKSAIEQQNLKKAEDAQAAFDLEYDTKMQEYEQEVSEFKKLAGDKVIPSDFLGRQDTSNSLQLGIAIALGGLANVVTNNASGPNVAIDMINKAIDKDIRAQEFNLDYKYKLGKENLNNKESIMSRMRQKFGDKQQAALATKSSMLQMALDKMQAKLNEPGGANRAAIQSKAQEAYANLKMDKLKVDAALKQQMMQAQSMQGVPGASSKTLTAEEIRAREAATGDKEFRKRFVNGLGELIDEKSRDYYREKIEPQSSSIATMHKMKDLINSGGVDTWTSEKRAEYNSLAAQLVASIKGKSDADLGVLTGPDMGIIKDMVGDATSFFSMDKNVLAKLNTKLQNVTTQVESRLKQVGADPEDFYKLYGMKQSVAIPNTAKSIYKKK